MDEATEALFVAQITAIGLAVKSLIATHPNPEAFAEAFRAYVAVFQSSEAAMSATQAGRDLFRQACEAMLEAMPSSK